MRNIKFRSWNENENKMTTPFAWINDSNMISTQICSSPTHELMQFTGILDRRGVEIYEGDIVHIDYVEYRPSPFNVDSFAGVVKLINGSFVVEKNSAISDFLFQETALVNVIGNIHQNPELIGE